MNFRILGPLEVAGDDGPLELGAAKPKALLGLLLVHANEPVSAERLIDELWEQRPPRSATTTLQTYVSQLRKRLGPVLQTRSTGYRLEVDPASFDAARFEQRLSVIGQADDQGPSWVADQLGEALRWWRGPALVDFAGASWADVEAARLGGLRLIAIEDLIEARLALGEHARLVPELETLVATHPLRERLWAQMMLALYRSDRQAEALRTYGRLRAHLGEELGIEPSAELARLEQAILLHEPELDWRPPAPESVAAHAVNTPVGLPTGVVTFLLTDVVGSTQLWDQQPAAMADALAVHDALITDAVRPHHGRVLKQHGEGDSTFAVFTRATDALGAALDSQLALAEQAWPPGIELSVRMAIHTGEAVERDGDYYGTTVNRAARLRALAEGGQVLASQSTVDLLVDHLPDEVELVEQGSRALRGLRRLERVYAVVPAGSSGLAALNDEEPRSDVGMPSSLARLQTEHFVGRAEELAHLDNAWRAARGGERRVVLIAGEPGMGKTFLAAELAQRVHSDGGVVLFGRCDDELGVAFQPFTEALRSYVASCAPAVLHAQARDGLSELSRLVPELGTLIPGLPPPRQADPETERYELFEGVVSVLNGVTRSTPVLLVLDDLHWAAKPTLLLLRHLARADAPMSLLVIGTYRDTEAQRTSALGQVLPDLRASAGVEQIILAGLSIDDVYDYLASTVGPSNEHPVFALALERETRGNPLFVREMVRHLAEHNTPVGAPGTPLPSTVRDVIERRLARLSPPTRKMLVSAAVIGLSFRIDVLEQLVSSDPEVRELLDSLDEAIDAGILTEPAESVDTLDFTHALIRDAIYTNLTSGRRSRLHKQIVQTLESFGDVADDDERLPALAYHSAQGAHLSLAATAADYAKLAGRQALTRLAFEEAIEYLERGLRALELAPQVDRHRRAQLLLTLGPARYLIGDEDGNRDAARRAAADARVLGDGELLAHAATLHAFWSGHGSDPATTQVLAEALDVLADDQGRLRARVLSIAAVNASAQGQSDRAERLAREGLSLARRLSDEGTLYQALRGRVESLYGSPRVEERLELVEELNPLEEALGDPVISLEGLHERLWAKAELGDLSGLEHYIDALETWQPRTGKASRVWLADSSAEPYPRLAVTFRRSPARFRAFGALLMGQWDQAETLSAKALEETPNDPDAFNAYALQLFQARREQGRLDELLPMMRAGLEDNSLPSAYRSALAVALADAGDLEEASSHLELLCRDDFAHLPRGVTWTNTLAALTEVCSPLGDAKRAESLYRLFAAHSRHLALVGLVVCTGAVDRYLGMLETVLGDWEAAEHHFEAALALDERIESPPLIARTKYWYGSMLVTHGAPKRQRGRALLSEARESAERLQMMCLAGQARERLDAS